MSSCSRCDSIPEAYPDKGILYFLSPVEHITKEVKDYFDQNKMSYSEVQENLLQIPYHVKQLEDFSHYCLNNFNDLQDFYKTCKIRLEHISKSLFLWN